MPVAAGRFEPGYSHCAQYISELGADGAAHAKLVSLAGFVPTGLLVLAFLGLAHPLLPGARRKAAGVLALAFVGLAYVASAAFPCDPGCPRSGSLSQTVHNAFGLLEYAGACLGLALLGAVFRAAPPWRRLAAPSRLLALGAGAGFVAMLLPPLASLRGLAQRVAEASIFSWVVLVAAFLVRERESAAASRAAAPLRELSFSSALHAAPETVWAHAVTPEGVNRELRPLVRMTFPRGCRDLTAGWEPGRTLFRSWLLLGGVLPVEYDDVALVEVEPGRRFLERSRLLSQRVWEHERCVEPAPFGCRITDRVRFAPRLAWLAPLHAAVFRMAFGVRHRNLRRAFGDADAARPVR